MRIRRLRHSALQSTCLIRYLIRQHCCPAFGLGAVFDARTRPWSPMPRGGGFTSATRVRPAAGGAGYPERGQVQPTFKTCRGASGEGSAKTPPYKARLFQGRIRSSLHAPVLGAVAAARSRARPPELRAGRRHVGKGVRPVTRTPICGSSGRPLRPSRNAGTRLRRFRHAAS